MRTRFGLRIGALAALLAALFVGAAPSQAQTAERCFPETGNCISGRIREYWERNGGLPVFGYPLGPQGQQTLEGKSFTAQLFERYRIELHPENKRPYDVEIGRMGVDRLEQQGRNWFTFPKADPNAITAGCRYFAETGHNVCNEFFTAYFKYGLDLGQPGISYEESLALFGLPVSEAMTETIEGKQYTVQWFERARFELHPENPEPYRVLFGRLGAELSEGTMKTPGVLTGTKWTLKTFGPVNSQSSAVKGSAATIEFGTDGRVSGTTGCNGYGGSYEESGNTISFGQIVSTLRACAPDISAQESAVTAVLKGKATFAQSGNDLTLTSEDGAQKLVFLKYVEAAVTGTISYRQRIALPPNAEIQVRLEDVSLADATVTIIGEQVFKANGKQVPFSFSIPYDANSINSSHTYSIRVRITVDGNLMFTTTSAYQVITNGNPTKVDVIVDMVSG